MLVFYMLHFLLFQFVRIVVQAKLVGAAFGDGFGAFHHERAALLTVLVVADEVADIAGRFGFDGMLAFRIVGAAVENTESSLSLGHFAVFANGTFDAGSRNRGTLFFLDIFAFRIIGAGDEFSEFSFTFDKFAFALRAQFAGFFRTFEFVALHGSGTGAFRKFRTAIEFS